MQGRGDLCIDMRKGVTYMLNMPLDWKCGGTGVETWFESIYQFQRKTKHA